MVTSGKLAKGPRPPSLCPHGACWPWLKIVQFLCCCGAQPRPQRAAGCCLCDSQGLGWRGFTQLSNPPHFAAAVPRQSGWGVAEKARVPESESLDSSVSSNNDQL